MTAEVVTGVESTSVTVVSRGRTARLRELAPFIPAGLLLGILFFVPLGVMFVFSLWTTNANLDIVPVWNLDNYAQFFESSAYVRTQVKTVVMGAGVTVICLVVAVAVAYFLARYISRRWARLALIVIIVPFWSSYLLRVYSWQAILGEKGALNQLLMGLGVISEPSRLLVYNDIGTFIVLIVAIRTAAGVIRSVARERTRRDIAAFIAEGSMTPEQGERLMRAGSKDA